MKQTVLAMVQNILSAMDSDNVSDIDETVESVQVAEILRESYYDLMSQRQWPHLRTLETLVGLGDLTNPTKMQIKETINKIYWIKYNKKEVVFMEPEDFQNMIDMREEQTGIVNANGFIVNADPTYWTTFDDKYVIFDGYNSDDDDTLQESKSKCYAVKVASWQHSNTFTPDMPDKFFPTLLSEAKAQCFVNLKQQANLREERKAQRGRVVLRNDSWVNQNGEQTWNDKVNYGR